MANDTNGASDVFLHDTTTGVTTLVTRNAQGGSANGGSSTPAISANGKYLAFDSSATNLAGAANAGIPGTLIYRYNIANGRIKLVSKSPNGALPVSSTFQAAISASGRYIAYSSRAHNIVPGDHNSGWDAFRYDATADVTIKVSRTLAGQETDKFSYATAISGNGRYVAWRTNATNMGPADTNNDEDAYVLDVDTGTTTLISHDSSGTAVGGRPTGISDNGKIVALTSSSDSLAPGDTDGEDDAFVYSASTGKATPISAAQWPDDQAATASISANGRYIAYTAFPLNDLTQAQVLLYDRQTKQSTTISVTPSGSAANGGSGTPSVSRSGNFFGFCSTATNLVPGDTYGNCDIFLWSRS